MLNPPPDSPYAAVIRQTASPWLEAGTAGITQERPERARDWVLRLYPHRSLGLLTLVAYVHDATGLTVDLSDGRIEYGPLEIGLGDEAPLADLVKAMLEGRIEGCFSTLGSRGWGRRLRWDGESWGCYVSASRVVLACPPRTIRSIWTPV